MAAAHPSTISFPILKRNGATVEFDHMKIVHAISRAAVEAGETNPAIPMRISLSVIERLQKEYFDPQKPLDVETIQDIVEEMLIAHGEARIAKGYILYRAEHKKLREERQQEIIEQVKLRSFKVIGEHGQEEIFDPSIWEHKIRTHSLNLKHVNEKVVMEEAMKLLYDGMPAKELPTAIQNATRTMMEQHYEYSNLAARLLADDLKVNILGKQDYADSDVRDGFLEYINKGVEYELISPELQKFDLAKISAAIEPSRDDLFRYLGMRTVHDRYLLKTPVKPQKIFELPQWMWMRVAMGLSIREKQREEKAIEFYNVLSQFYFVSSTPTLFNSGTTHSQMSSCYLNTVTDSLDHIFKSYGDIAQLSKWAGGIGTDWTPVRSTGAMIKGTNGGSQGVIPFLKIFNDTCIAVNQGGKRRGAMAAYLEMWHGDVEEFLELRKNTGDERRRTHDIHPALWIPDLFMKRVEADQEWTLFSPSEVPDLHDLYGKAFEEKYAQYETMNLPSARKVKAVDLWRRALTLLYETGHPWITFKDPCNIRSPQDHVGVIHNSNLCTEITLNDSADETAVCNLGSLNLAKHIKDGALDDARIQETTKTAMRMLDNVIDINFYPTKEAENSNLKHRPVGLGLMGYHDALYQLGIEFASDRQIEFADEAMETISYYAIMASSLLAKERGSYSSYRGSKWDRGILPIDTLDILEWERGVPLMLPKGGKRDWSPVREHIAKYGMRNSNTMAIAPTATISNIAGSVPCVEPIFKNVYMKENLSGNFLVLNSYLVDDLMAEGIWDEDMVVEIKSNNGSVQGLDRVPLHLQRKYLEVFEIEPRFVLEAAARRQKWIDQACSTNVFLKTTSGKILSQTYMNAWKMGLKTTYYLRTLAATQVTKATTKKKSQAAPLNEPTTPVVEAAPVAQPMSANAAIKAMMEPDCEACQ